MASDSPAAILFDTSGNPVTVSPFGSLHVATPYTLADLNHKYEIDSREFGIQTATGGTVTHLPNESAARCSVTGTSGSTASLRSHTYFRYQSGKAMLVRLSVYCSDAGQSNQIRRWGIFDTNDGLFFQLSGTTLSLVRRTSTSGVASDVTIATQASWNRDKLDGTGSSGITLDVTKGNLYEIHYQWLGVGRVRFVIDGITIHEHQFANTISMPFIKTAVLPTQIEITNVGASSAGSLTNICQSVLIMGGTDAPEYSYAAQNATQRLVSTTEIPIIAIRPKSSYNSITNRILVLPTFWTTTTEGSRITARLYMNPATLTGASWVSADSKSGVEYDVSATAFTGGEFITGAMLPNSNDVKDIRLDWFFSHHARKLRLDAFASAADVLLVTAINEAAGNTSVRSSLTWKEIR